ncbi:UDP-3-O-(3-hydroxymyristoyl)glucosamine N-acyltransferase [bacterium]|nr:UDP-3-O-(3-hydroxymyristoyl)glucosamine N-acyltransferase [bacterium]
MKLVELATLLNGKLVGDKSQLLNGIANLDDAKSDQLSFVLDKKFIKQATQSAAIAFVVYEEIAGLKNQIIVQDPKKALAQTIHAFFSENDSLYKQEPVIGASSIIASTAVIENGVVIGEGVSIGHQAVICSGTEIADNVIIQQGAVIGSKGFGYYIEQGRWYPIPHIGTVSIQANVEIGANTCIDRGCLGQTVIKQGTKIDNLVHIAHNTVIGEHCAIAAQVGCTGSVKIGNYVMVGGQAGIDGVEVGDGAIIAGKSGVTKSIKKNEKVSGFPAWDHKQELKKEATIRKLIKKEKI